MPNTRTADGVTIASTLLVRMARFYRRIGHFSLALRILKRVHKSTGSNELAYEVGVLNLKIGELSQAEKYFKLCLAGKSPKAEWWYRYAVVLERQKKYQLAIDALNVAIRNSPDISEYRYRRGVCALYCGEKSSAIDDFEGALSLNASDLRPIKRIPLALSSSTPLWRRKAILGLSGSIQPENHEILKEYARVCYWMGSYRETVDSYDRVYRSSGLDQNDLYKYVCAIDACGLEYENIQSQLILGSRDKIVLELGIGALHEINKNIGWAIRSYTRDNDIDGLYPLRSYHLGLLYEKCWDWEHAEKWFNIAADLLPGNDYWQYKAGLNSERCGNFEHAIYRYNIAADLKPSAAKYWYYRIGCCFLQLNEQDSAYSYLQLSYDGLRAEAEVPGTAGRPLADAVVPARLRATLSAADSKVFLNAAHRHMALGDDAIASSYYLKYLDVVEPRSHDQVRSIASCLHRAGLKELALSVLIDGRPFTMPDGLDVKQLTKTTAHRRTALYAEYVERLSVDASCILYEAYWGSSVSCNPLAIFRYLSESAVGKDLTHVWVYQNAESIPRDFNKYDNVRLVKYGSDRYLKYLATAKYLVNNATFAPFFVRREDQRYINTWHGTPLKTLGRATNYALVDDANTIRNFQQASVIAAPNSYTASVLKKDFDLGNRGARKVVTLGSPRLDQVVRSDATRVQRLRAALGLQLSDKRQIILYAPTWRGTNTSREVDADALQKDLETLDEVSDDVLVLFRGHHLTEGQLRNTNLQSRIVPRSIDTYELLQVTDILVSDYSSLLFDFVSTGRPTLAYVPDEEDYLLRRGLYLRPSAVFRTVARSRDELRVQTEKLLYASGSNTLVDNNHGILDMEDGCAAERVGRELLGLDHQMAGVTTKGGNQSQVVGIFASLLPNGITSALRDLVNSLPSSAFEVVLFVDSIGTPTEYIETFVSQLRRPVRILLRHVDPVFTLEEQTAFAEFKRQRRFLSDRHRAIVKKGFSRELHRMVGDASIDVLVQFEGYASYWTALFACAESIGARSVLYLHNQMQHEVEVKYPYLREIFSWLRDYDEVASVSKPVAEINHRFLVDEGYLDPGTNVSWFRNVIDVDRIRELANDLSTGLVPKDGPCLVAVGRLSVEKNHILIINMLPKLIVQFPGLKLKIAGEGPLRPTLEAKVASLGLASNVDFLGQVDNPYPLIRDADVFLLPSLHEGQPVVLFEAAALGTSYVAAPTPGVSDATEILGGRVVEASEGAFADAVIESLANPSAGYVDFGEINREAIERFYSLVGMFPVS